MSETQWEYCRLFIRHPKEHKKGAILGFGGELQGYGYDCTITFYGDSGEPIVQEVSVNTEVSKGTPFSTAMGLLGSGCWELVNVQHGNLATTSGGSADYEHYNWDTISTQSVVAYFKRPVVSGRAINEPKLVFFNR